MTVVRNGILRRQEGFTLVEMLLVLAITMMVVMIGYQLSIKHLEQQRTVHVFRQLQMDLHYLQSYAMAHKETVTYSFINKGSEYNGTLNGGKVILRRKMPEGYYSNPQHRFKIVYLPNGNVLDFGVLTFHTPEGSKQLYVYIGKGRMYLDE